MGTFPAQPLQAFCAELDAPPGIVRLVPLMICAVDESPLAAASEDTLMPLTDAIDHRLSPGCTACPPRVALCVVWVVPVAELVVPAGTLIVVPLMMCASAESPFAAASVAALI